MSAGAWDYVDPKQVERISASEFLRLAKRAFAVSYQARGKSAVIMACLGFAFALVPSALSVLLRLFTDAVQGLCQGTTTFVFALGLLLALMALYVLQQGYIALSGYYVSADAERILRYLNERILRCVCTVRMRHIDGADDFAEKVSFAATQAGLQVAGSMQQVTLWLQNLLSFVVLSVVLVDVGAWIIPVILVTCLPSVVIAYRQEQQRYRLGREQSREVAFGQMYFQDCTRFQCLQELKFQRIFPYIKQSKWLPTISKVLEENDALVRRHTLVSCLADLLRGCVYLVVLTLMAYSIYRDPSLGLGAFTLVVSATSQMQNLVSQMFFGAAQFAAQAPYLKDFFWLEDLEREAVDSDGRVDRSGAKGLRRDGAVRANAAAGVTTASLQVDRRAAAPAVDICFEHVSFAYPESEHVALSDVSVTIHEGERIAIVGRNGSGKSTFVNLLCGLYEPTQGSVSLAGREVADDVAGARSLISGVFQDFGRYEDTIRFNVAVSDTDRVCSDEEMMALLEKVDAAEFVVKRGGLDAVVGSYSEGGSNLSGGQWQRLAIARAAYCDRARIMLLDEPTSALDPVAEASIYRNFADLVGDRTALFVSHRLGVSSIVDRVLVFDAGCLVEDGTPKELLAAGGLYAELYESQAQWYR